MALVFKLSLSQVVLYNTLSSPAIPFKAQPGEQVLFSSTTPAFVRIGSSTIGSATVADHTVQIGPIPIVIQLRKKDTHFSVIETPPEGGPPRAPGVLTLARLRDDAASSY